MRDIDAARAQCRALNARHVAVIRQVDTYYRLPDGRMKWNVFTYDWRLWTLAETLDLLEECGLRLLEIQNEISQEASETRRPVA